MSRTTHRAVGLAALLLTAACAERPSPLEPRADAAASSAAPNAGTQAASASRAIHERLARHFGRALADAEFRAAVFRALAASTAREGKVHLQSFLSADGGRERQRMARLAAEADAVVAEDLEAAAPIEVYLPVPEHRRVWRGAPNLLVATAETDREAPVAFDTRGRRHVLNPDRPPATPVIALVRAEASFAPVGIAGVSCEICFDPPPDESTGSPSTGPVPGLYLTYTSFNATFEGWLKGAPEFEVHILGQDGTSSAMQTYQCVGESAGAPYQFNQDEKSWSGSVMLFSQTQLDAYNAAHPDQALRVFVVEDDDTRCAIKTDSTRISTLLKQLETAYGQLTGGRDKILSVKTFKNAKTLLNIFKSVWSVIQTPDDVVGFAVEDVVAREYHPGANWIVKADNTVTNGALRLEMR